MPKVLTPIQVDSYRRDGLLFPLPVLNAAEVAHFRACRPVTSSTAASVAAPRAQQKGDCHL